MFCAIFRHWARVNRTKGPCPPLPQSGRTPVLTPPLRGPFLNNGHKSGATPVSVLVGTINSGPLDIRALLIVSTPTEHKQRTPVPPLPQPRRLVGIRCHPTL